MKEQLKKAEERMGRRIDHLCKEYSEIRAGRANPAVLDKVKVDYYGAPTPVNQLAAVSVTEARTLTIQPWDTSILRQIEKAIQKSDIGINPNNDGKVIRMQFPPLTEDRRKDIVKDVQKLAEETKVQIRNVRRETIEKLKAMKKASELTEDDLKQGRFNSSLSVDSAVRLSLMFQYFTGARSLRQFAYDFKGNSLVETMVILLSQAIQELSRPIDAIKHQAKTVTVGISRSEELATGPVFEALQELSITPDDLPYRDLVFLRALNTTIDQVLGSTLYEVDGLNALNEVTEDTRIKVVHKTGISRDLRSRSEHNSPLVGTKQWVTNNRRSYVGHGRNDNRPMLITPVIRTGRVDHLALLHLRFKTDLPLASRVEVIKNLTNRYGDLVSQVEETNIIWRDEFLNMLSVEELATLRAAVLAEMIIARMNAKEAGR